MIKQALQAERELKRLNRYDEDTLSIMSGAPTLSLQGVNIASRQITIGASKKQSKTSEKQNGGKYDKISLVSVDSLSKNIRLYE